MHLIYGNPMQSQTSYTEHFIYTKTFQVKEFVVVVVVFVLKTYVHDFQVHDDCEIKSLGSLSQGNPLYNEVFIEYYSNDTSCIVTNQCQISQ